MVDSHTYTPTTVDRLHMVSLGCCMNPDCRTSLIKPLDPRRTFTEENSFIAKNIAHIHSGRSNGPRYDSAMSIDELRAYSNLLLLCLSCHKMIDERPGEFPADMLESWKSTREAESQRSLASRPSLLATVVHAIAMEDAIDAAVGDSDDLVAYEIVEKIAFNELSESAWLIRQYVAYEGVLQRLYVELEEQNPRLKVSLLRYVGAQYQQIKSVYLSEAQRTDLSVIDVVKEHSDEIFYEVRASLTDLVMANHPMLTYEEVTFGVLIVVVDAFIDCKVLEPPI